MECTHGGTTTSKENKIRKLIDIGTYIHQPCCDAIASAKSLKGFNLRRLQPTQIAKEIKVKENAEKV